MACSARLSAGICVSVGRDSRAGRRRRFFDRFRSRVSAAVGIGISRQGYRRDGAKSRVDGIFPTMVAR
jgi:hypothetical protein